MNPEERNVILEEAARVAYVTCAKTRHVRLGTECEQAIRALKTTPAPAVTEDDQALLTDIFDKMAEVVAPLPGIPDAPGDDINPKGDAGQA